MSRNENRLGPRPNQQVNLGRPVTFYFEGRAVQGYEGDTVAAALFAAGRRIFSRSFKYHRPRGLLCCSGDCPNCLMEIDSKPNQRSCRTMVKEGMLVFSQNAWPTLDQDVLQGIELFDRLLPIGFYYKAMHKPRLLWKFAEPVIRRLAGLGRVRKEAAAGEYEHRYEYADVMIVGGGPAGMEAAKQAAATGAAVFLVDREPELGGHLLFETRTYEYEGRERPGYEIARLMASAIADLPNVRVLSDASVFGSYEGNLYPVLQDNALIHLRSKSLVVTTGCHQFPPVFRNNDLPGVMLSRAALRLINLYGIRPGNRVAVVTADDEGYFTALECLREGIGVAAIADARPGPCTFSGAAHLRGAGVSILTGVTALAALGAKKVSGIEVGSVGDAEESARNLTIDCDSILLSTGWQGNASLLLQSGCELALDHELGQPVPLRMPPGVLAGGEVLGFRSLDEILSSGRLAGKGAVQWVDLQENHWWDEARRMLADSRTRTASCRIAPAGESKNFVCFCEDVTEKDLHQGVEEGYDEIETLKRYSTVSMGPCQGRMCSRNSAEICGLATGKDSGAVGTTTARPPIAPVPLGALAGAEFHPVKQTAMHYKHLEAGATMMNMGVWKRPLQYSTVSEEYEAVRKHAGLIDVSTLGKIAVQGIDAPRLLDKVYTHRMSNLAPGRARYGVICDESGAILDDGTVARLGPERFYITTSTGNVDFVEQWMKWWLAGTGWCVHILNVTAGFAAVNLAGPSARRILAGLTEMDLSSFPYMGCGEATVAGVPALLLRVGFVGETGWEIHFPAEYGEYLWDELLEAGGPLSLRPFGVEAQRTLRLEKRHVIVGQDTDGLSNPYDADLQWVVKLDKADFVGRHALQRLKERQSETRLVGVEFADGVRPEDGSAVVVGGKLAGRVTSARFSPHLNRYVGLAWVPAASAEPGSRVEFRARGLMGFAVVVAKAFYDPEGERLK